MQTTKHNIYYEDSRQLSILEDNCIDLIVTSPPYPMIEMWDKLFTQLDPNIGRFLESGDYRNAFEAMHGILDEVWCELFRVMRVGAFACINIGDATRTINNQFQLFANHSRIHKKLFDIGFNVLPVILWRKQTNAPTKFMGSGMLPAGAYVTLEHEYILIVRKGNKRIFKTSEEKLKRMQSGYFWEERNTWFSDVWDLKGVRQETSDKGLRKRSAAYPLVLPFRLINMYSVLGDTVLDPFLGTGTTTLAAMATGRNSIGCEIEKSFALPVKNRIGNQLFSLNELNLQRLTNHISFVRNYAKEKGEPKYINNMYGFPVITKQEIELLLAFVKSAEATQNNSFVVNYFDDDFIGNLNIENLTIEQLQAKDGLQQTIPC